MRIGHEYQNTKKNFIRFYSVLYTTFTYNNSVNGNVSVHLNTNCADNKHCYNTFIVLCNKGVAMKDKIYTIVVNEKDDVECILHSPAINGISYLVANCQLLGNITDCGECECDEQECLANLILTQHSLEEKYISEQNGTERNN